ncbi:hypothetical protein K461DRAFT_292024 [Myriangium duriaei CBS 260.36]|uniref:Uncharacterized protein n=1 Tax=Myriangium duriaei CBS 260.36 TaxID=1168546 RepID=A0A9P4J8M6_9PEZI|nr:hypothetical protein K461DRAFT_292024 [Myriangium duriaei CBS 260.36]
MEAVLAEFTIAHRTSSRLYGTPTDHSVLVSPAPASSPLDTIQEAIGHSKISWSALRQSLQVLTIDAVTAVYPSYNESGFTNVSSDLYHSAYAPYQACLPTENILLGALSSYQLAKPDWSDASEVVDWQNLMEVGNKRFAGPVVLLSGNNNGSDRIIFFDGPLLDSILSSVDRLCGLMKQEGWEESHGVVGYKGVNHFPIIQASESLWLDWIKQRLNGASSSPLLVVALDRKVYLWRPRYLAGHCAALPGRVG